MHISFNTEELSELDVRVLRAVVGVEGESAPTPAAKAAPAEEAPAPTKKAAKKAEKKAEPEPEPEEETEVDEEAEDDEEAEETEDELTLKDAVAMATKMVSNGEAAKVKAALNSVGAKRVSEVAEDKVATFVAKLNA